MTDQTDIGCTPDKCTSCSGCGGDAIEKITLTLEWRHKGETGLDPTLIEKNMFQLAEELAISGVELVYINNTFSPDIPDPSSEFLINTHPLGLLIPDASGRDPTLEQIRKGIFQALLRNI